MIMVGISGTPSTGKSTLARLICSSCKSIPKIKTTELVSEYARKYISKHGPMKEIWEQSRILTRQLEWEDSVKNSTDLLVTDSPVHLSFLYSVDIEKKNEKDIMVFNDIFKILSKLSKPNPRYDFIFHLPPVISPIKDNVREEKQLNEMWREESDSLIRSIFKIFPQKRFKVIQSLDINDRVTECLGYLSDYLKE